MKTAEAVAYSLLGAALAIAAFFVIFEAALHFANAGTQFELRAMTSADLLKLCAFVFVMTFLALLRGHLMLVWQEQKTDKDL